MTIDLIEHVGKDFVLDGWGRNKFEFGASLYSRTNSWRDLAIGSMSKRDADVASRSITAVCLV